jgi:hypothetical protein
MDLYGYMFENFIKVQTEHKRRACALLLVIDINIIFLYILLFFFQTNK